MWPRLSVVMILSLGVLAACDPKGVETGLTGDTNDTDNTDTNDTWDTQDTNSDVDADGDGVSPADGDCDDANADIHPGASETCNEVDDDCDDKIDEDLITTYYADKDGDKYGDASDSVEACEPPPGYAESAMDCDDSDPKVNPEAEEVCNNADDNCDGNIDDGVGDTWYADADGDGHGDHTMAKDSCDQPEGYVAADDDCDDADAMVHPGAEEACNESDDDCDGSVDEDAGLTWYADADKDGFGDAGVTAFSCDQPPGYAGNSDDCNDGESAINPSAAELCNSIDDDCSGVVDDNPVDGDTWWPDMDNDGFGDADNPLASCEQPSGYTDNGMDCLDSDPAEPVIVSASATSSGSGTMADPFQRLQDGIDASNACVWAWPGVYSENISFNGKSIEVTGVDGADATIIEGSDSAPTVTFASGEGADAVLSGFTITGGGGLVETTRVENKVDSYTSTWTTYNRYYGGGILVDGASPTLEDLRVDGNALPAYSESYPSSTETEITESYGGGLFVANSTLSASNLYFTGNFADDGGAIHVAKTGDFSVQYLEVISNTAASGAGVSVASGGLTITNAVLANNTAEDFGSALDAAGGSAYVVNATIVGNTTGSTGAALYLSESAALTLENSIVAWNNGGYGIGAASATSGALSDYYTDVYMNDGGQFLYLSSLGSGYGNFQKDPMFADFTNDGDYSNDDLSLSSGSPAIDAGNPATFDADGSRADMGAWGGPGSSW